LGHVDLEPFTLFLVALGTAFLIRWIAQSQPLLVWLALRLCVGGALAVLTLLVCFASGTPMVVQEKIASAALFMAMVGGILFASVYRSGGDGPFPPDDDPCNSPDDPGGDHAYPWWPEFERELRDYEAARSSEPVVGSARQLAPTTTVAL